MRTDSTPQGEAPVRRPGRPRSDASHRAILDATARLLADGGWSRLTIDRVVEMARVSKATIYRRWPTKEDMVVAALAHSASPPVRPDTGTVRGDLVGLLNGELSSFARSPAGRMLVGLAPELAGRSRLAAQVRSGFAAPRIDMLRDVLRDGIVRGELRSDLDLNLAVHLLAGPVLVRLVSGADTGANDLSERVVDLALSGLAQN